MNILKSAFGMKSGVKSLVVFSIIFLFVQNEVFAQTKTIQEFVVITNGQSILEVDKDVLISSGDIGSVKSIKLDKNFSITGNIHSSGEVEFDKDATIVGSVYAAENKSSTNAIESDKNFTITGSLFSGSKIKIKSGSVNGTVYICQTTEPIVGQRQVVEL